MARDPDTIEREIEQARSALAATLDELGTRADPKKFVEQGKQTLQSKMEATLQNPQVRYALMGVGALFALLLLRKLFR
ncbi:MAG: DUF3618 domain-containing protein [Pseudonocardiaceae bacterium]|nr:DUF3618 domain-containing protein [Pseudonocardiaceae bacterium]